jgi:hypothetical protein
MKKTIALFIITAAFAACSNNSTSTATTDSTTVKVDSLHFDTVTIDSVK